LKLAASKWLLIFDNADNLDVLRFGWPGGAIGSILITTRDFSAMYHPASRGLEIKCFEGTVGAMALLKILGPDYDKTENLELATSIADELGGWPLAINQMCSYIRQQKLRLDRFLPLYKKHQTKIHATIPASFDYPHTISTIWNVALSSLPTEAAALQFVVAFLDPDNINEDFLRESVKNIVDAGEAEELRFILDDFE
jgi:hypothetical protein